MARVYRVRQNYMSIREFDMLAESEDDALEMVGEILNEYEIDLNWYDTPDQDVKDVTENEYPQYDEQENEDD